MSQQNTNQNQEYIIRMQRPDPMQYRPAEHNVEPETPIDVDDAEQRTRAKPGHYGIG